MKKKISEQEAQIDKFLGFFKDKFQTIQTTKFPESGHLFKKLLYVGLLDALSKTTSYPKQGNRDRFVSFIKNFGGWQYCEKISLPHLIRLLQKVHTPEFSSIRKYAFEQFDGWQASNFPTLKDDLDFADVKKRWPANIPKPLEDIQIESLKHCHLFYNYRSSLIHELREPGYGFEMKHDKEPYYHQHHDIDNDITTWELVYPLGFYELLCSNVLTALKPYYIKDRIDPYRCYSFGSYFIEGLNI
ncbi:MAG: hypothetical protein H6Q54_2047 [Deltaproteobacteria bacterium]|jgi:hypothetical protein|nr:hypothetical protein [Deltaproteobacteria bacterium]